MKQLQIESLKKVYGSGVGSPDLPDRVQVAQPAPKKSCGG